MKLGKKLQEQLKKAPTMSMDELENMSDPDDFDMSDPDDFDMDQLEHELEEDDDTPVEIGVIEKIKNTTVKTVEKMLEYVSDNKFLIGVVVGVMYTTIACALSYKKKWDYVEK